MKRRSFIGGLIGMAVATFSLKAKATQIEADEVIDLEKKIQPTYPKFFTLKVYPDEEIARMGEPPSSQSYPMTWWEEQ